MVTTDWQDVLPRGGNMICDGYGLEITDADEILILLRITPWEEALTAPTKASDKKTIRGYPLEL